MALKKDIITGISENDLNSAGSVGLQRQLSLSFEKFRLNPIS